MHLLKTEIFEGIAAKKMTSYLGIQLLRRKLGDEYEFTTIMWFDQIENVKQFIGEDHERAYVLPQAQKLLKLYNKRSAHHEVLQELKYAN